MKIYAKRGAQNYKEKRLISELEIALQKFEPNQVEGLPAKSYEELTALHDKYCGQFDTYEEVKDEPNKMPEKTTSESKAVEASKAPETAKQSTPSSFIDPFNDAEPIVRDYVMNDGFTTDTEPTARQQQSFAEPTSFEESFELPSQEDEKSDAKPAKEKQPKKEPAPPVNPQFDEMSSGKKRRSTKKFAKMIVDGTCILAEKGCIWWTTKDITEDKLVQYELENVMDLQLLLTLDEGQQITVREWFRGRVIEADVIFKVSDEDKEDLTDSLYEVMLEKGVAPTPMQELIINAVKTFVLDMGLKALNMQKQIQSVLTQLKSMHETTIQQSREVDLPEVDTVDDIKNPYIDDVKSEVEDEIIDTIPVP
jgi:hypothetical protein